MSVTPFMELTLPDVNSTLGPLWAQEVITAMYKIDRHDHTGTNGVQISIASLNINADLALSSYNLTQARSLRLQNYTSTTVPSWGTTEKGLFFASDGEIYWRDQNGNNVKITSNGTVNAGVGSIGGMFGTDAAVGYNDLSKTYTFLADNTNGTPASFVASGLAIGKPSASGTSTVMTQTVDTGIGSSYGVVWPASPPASKQLMTMSSAGVLGFAGALPASTQVLTMDSSGNIGYGNATPAPGLVPIGGVIPIVYTGSNTGMWTPPASGAVKDGYMLCDGATSSGHTMNGPLPNLTGARFLMGNTLANIGGTGGNSSNQISLSHSHSTNSQSSSSQVITMAHTHTLTTAFVAMSTGTGGGGGQAYIFTSGNLRGSYTSNRYWMMSVNSSYGTTSDTADGASRNGFALVGSTDSSSPSATVNFAHTHGTDSQLSSSQSILPQYLNCVYVIRVM